jgi:hypothetical protein
MSYYQYPINALILWNYYDKDNKVVRSSSTLFEGDARHLQDCLRGVDGDKVRELIAIPQQVILLPIPQTDEETKILKRLESLTFAVEHSPNCPSPYLVRLTGTGRGEIDHKPKHETQDVLGYGKTLAEAGLSALYQSGRSF